MDILRARAQLEAEWVALRDLQQQCNAFLAERDALAVRVRELEAERDAITELNHAQWLALENARHLAARNRNEEWAQHTLRWCTEAGNSARILRAAPAPLSDAEERAEFDKWFRDEMKLNPNADTTGIDAAWLPWRAWKARAGRASRGAK